MARKKVGDENKKPKRAEKEKAPEAPAANQEKEDSQKAQKLLSILKKGMKEIHELADMLGISVQGVIDLASELSRKNYDIHISSGKKRFVSLTREEVVNLEPIPVSAVNKKFRIGVIADVRFGCKQAQISLLHWVYEVFEKEDVDFVVLDGGLVVGKPSPTLLPDMIKTDKDELVQYVVDYFPKNKKFKTYIVSGRGELSWKTNDGFDIISAICEKRPDLSKIGELERDFLVRNVLIRFVAPNDDHSMKMVSYRPQTIADNISGSPQILVIGGTHRRSFIPAYNSSLWVVTVPSLHKKMGRQGKRGVKPRIGFGIIELNFNDDKTFDINNGGLKVILDSLDAYAVPNDWYNVDSSLVSKSDEEAKKVLGWFEKELILSEGEISRRLNKSKDAVKEIIKRLEKYGFEIPYKKDSKRYELQVKEKTHFSPLPLKYEDVYKPATKEAGISDPHLNSKQELVEILNKAYKDAAEAGCRRVYNAGDVTDGPGSAGYRGHMFDVKSIALDDITDSLVVKWPRVKIQIDPKKPPVLVTQRVDWPDGKIGYQAVYLSEGETWLQTDAIEGNHDAWAWEHMGVKMVRALAIRLPDYIRYVGFLSGSVEVDGVFHKLIHPKGGGGYTLSMIVQRHLKAMKAANEGKGKPVVLYVGHLHSPYLLFDKRLGIRMPCIKAKDDFHEVGGYTPSVGIFINEIFVDKTGTQMTRVVAEYRNYHSLVNRKVDETSHL